VTSATRIVPGDVLTKTCPFKVDGVGDHMRVELGLTKPTELSGGNALSSALDLGAVFTGDQAGVINSGETQVAKDEVITADFTVTFPTGAGNDTNVHNGLQATLDSIGVTVSQGHGS
jgi:alternate signal-mediated exported protein